uniref:HNH nuclease domain-containing protein n=1 Tax=Aliivibrio wodanis TaxID=80852 RepID=A0A5Q4ZI52_9GAMM|nr:hypothetical protein AW0309160_01393 [Aliivibrio wodanis]
MASRYVKPTDLALLWGRAGGSCSICKVNLLKELPLSGNVNLGEKAHIIPHSKNGPRGEGEREGESTYENLILLCGYHHKEIDRAEKDYPRSRLLEIKGKHESFVRESIDGFEQEKLISNILSRIEVEGAPKVVPVLLVQGSSHRSFSDIVPKFIQIIFGGSFGYYRVAVDFKNIGSKRAERVTIRITAKHSTIPKGYTFSTNTHITKNSTPSSVELEIECGPLNVGEWQSNPAQFYLNYRRETPGDCSYIEISKVEFDYYLTCDNNELIEGTLKIANA